jgi:hypothetical protein
LKRGYLHGNNLEKDENGDLLTDTYLSRWKYLVTVIFRLKLQLKS